MIGIDLQGMALDDSAQQIEAGALIPSPTLIEIDEGEKDYEAQQDRGLAMMVVMKGDCCGRALIEFSGP
jgi:hypothetical protein